MTDNAARGTGQQHQRERRWQRSGSQSRPKQADIYIYIYICIRICVYIYIYIYMQREKRIRSHNSPVGSVEPRAVAAAPLSSNNNYVTNTIVINSLIIIIQSISQFISKCCHCYHYQYYLPLCRFSAPPQRVLCPEGRAENKRLKTTRLHR